MKEELRSEAVWKGRGKKEELRSGSIILSHVLRW
jgi:hypothetical protein